MPLTLYQEKDKIGTSSVKKVIGIAAGKGGVGKSTIAVNLALALKHLGYKVGLLDTDLYGPSIRKMLPEDQLPSQKGQVIIPAVSNGIQTLSMAYFCKDHEATAVRAPIANSLVTQFLQTVAWDSLDYLLIDFPPGTGDIQLTLSQKANLSGAVMVTTPQEVAVMDVRKAMQLFDQVKIPILGIVENMSYFLHEETQEKLYLFGKEGGKRLAEETGVPFLGSIPIDSAISQSGDHGESLFDRPENKKLTENFTALAEKVVGSVSQQDKDCIGNFELHWQEMNK